MACRYDRVLVLRKARSLLTVHECLKTSPRIEFVMSIEHTGKGVAVVLCSHDRIARRIWPFP